MEGQWPQRENPLKKDHNVVSGEFAKKGQKDWAVLCSKNHVSSILIFWGGESTCPSEINQLEDKSSLQGYNGTAMFSRAIRTVSSSKMKSFRTNEKSKSFSIDHQGIGDDDLDKFFVVEYCDKGKWLTFNKGYSD